MSQQQIINSLLNLHQLFTTLHQLKFKGRKILEELINSRYEESIIIKHARGSSQTIIYEQALNHCRQSQGELISKYQETVLQLYIVLCSKVQLNLNYLSNALEKKDFDPPLSPYRFLLLELIHIGLDIGQGYQQQKELIEKLWAKNTGAIFEGNENEEDLKEYLLHVGFETHIEQEKQDAWRLKMVAVSNQRYNPRK